MKKETTLATMIILIVFGLFYMLMSATDVIHFGDDIFGSFEGMTIAINFYVMDMIFVIVYFIAVIAVFTGFVNKKP